MTIGYIGLGKMGQSMTALLRERGYDVVAYDVKEEARTAAEKEGVQTVATLSDLVSTLNTPRKIWIMVPRAAVDSVLDNLTPLLAEDDTVIDGGNSFYKDSMRRGEDLGARGITFLDAGVSGGVEGARHGACIMVGGDHRAFDACAPIFRDLAVPEGYGYMGASGAGHFVKMVHNAIEYGMMGAIAEGMQAIQNKSEQFNTDLSEVIKVYGHGSIIEGRLISEWLTEAWNDGPGLSSFPDEVPYGETEEEMEKLIEKTGVPVLEAALGMRVGTRREPRYAGRVINALRKYFGGHTSK